MTNWIIESRILAPSVLSFAVAMGWHIAVRWIWRRAAMRSVLTGSLVAGAVLCVLWVWSRTTAGHEPGRITDAVAALAIYVGLAYAYADLYGFHRGAVRLQALRFIHRNGGAAREDELRHVCGIETTVDHRLAQYLERGELILVDGKYRLARRRILFITRGFRFARRLMLGTRPGSV